MDWKTVAVVLESPVEGMNEQELHNFCRFLYSQLQTKDDELKRLSSNVQELTQHPQSSAEKSSNVNDGEYTIDNLAAERAIRPQTIQRKGSLFFGSVRGALKSAMFNTFIQTCKQAGISFRQYFKALFKAIKAGRTDYENLLPMAICLKSLVSTKIR